jgi:malate permease and related proteins
MILSILLDVISPVALIVAIGLGWGFAKQPFDTRSFSLISTYVGTPCLVIDSLGSSGLTWQDIAGIGGGAALCVSLSLIFGLGLILLARQSIPTFLPASSFCNCGNMGLPLCLFAFGQQGLNLAIAYFAVHALFTFTIGQALAARRFSLREVMFSPMIWATIFSVWLSASGQQLPLFVGRAVHILGGLTIPMMLMALGVSLAQLRVKSVGWPILLSAYRLVGGFAIGWGVAYVTGLTGAARGVLVLESAMPVAVYNYMFAARFNNRAEDVAGLVVISTALALPMLPLFLASVM